MRSRAGHAVGLRSNPGGTSRSSAMWDVAYPIAVSPRPDPSRRERRSDAGSPGERPLPLHRQDRREPADGDDGVVVGVVLVVVLHDEPDAVALVQLGERGDVVVDVAAAGLVGLA